LPLGRRCWSCHGGRAGRAAHLPRIPPTMTARARPRGTWRRGQGRARAVLLRRRGLARANGGRDQRRGLGKRGWPCGLAGASHGVGAAVFVVGLAAWAGARGA